MAAHPWSPTHRAVDLQWLDKVPTRWETHRIKSVVTNVADLTDDLDEGDTYVQLEDVESWTGKLMDRSDRVEFESRVKRFRPNDILFGKLRPYLAEVLLARVRGVCVSEFLVLRSETTALIPEYLATMLRTRELINLIDSATFGARMPRAEWKHIGNIFIPVPSIAEQTAIVDCLNAEMQTIEDVIGRARSQVQLANEYRERLIADVVTGRYDVRKLVPDLLDEGHEF